MGAAASFGQPGVTLLDCPIHTGLKGEHFFVFTQKLRILYWV